MVDATGHVDHLQNGEGNIILIADQPKLIAHAVDSGIGNVDPVQVGKEVDHAEDGNNPHIDPSHQR